VHRNAAAVLEAACRLGLDVEVQEFPAGTRTADDAARAVGTNVDQIVKSLVFVADGDPVLALVSGGNRLDPAKLARAIGADQVERADPDTVREATGFPIGGVPPFGHPSLLRCLLDRDLLAHDVVWAAAGTPTHVFAMAPRTLVEVTAAEPADLAQR
jgi:prolyl-tRNA editing enzyme YbaK/EbsC (Cys-tRNA(Pro) deacylase)